MEDFIGMDKQDNNFKEFVDDIKVIAKELQTIYSRAETDYTSAVNDVIRSQNKDVKEIEHLLNYMLDFADNEKILALYRKLCRYYLDINPQATSEYIQSYKEIYDEDEKLFKSGYFKNNPIKFCNYSVPCIIATKARASNTFLAFLIVVSITERITAKAFAPSCERNNPETFCLTLKVLTALSEALLSGGISG